MHLTSNQETSFNGALKNNFIETLSPRKFEQTPSLKSNENLVSIKEVDNLKNIEFYFSSQSATRTLVTAAVVMVGAFTWSNDTQIETFESPTSVFQNVIENEDKTQYISLFTKISQELTWLRDFYKTALMADTAKDIYPLITGISDLFSNKKYDIVDKILDQAELGKLSPTAMTTLVRTTYPARQKLSNWNRTVLNVKNVLEESGLDANKILRGLV